MNPARLLTCDTLISFGRNQLSVCTKCTRHYNQHKIQTNKQVHLNLKLRQNNDKNAPEWLGNSPVPAALRSGQCCPAVGGKSEHKE